MNERELKNKINELRQKIDQNNKMLRSCYHEIDLHKNGANELREKRDKLNREAKDLGKKINEIKEQRDKINNKIRELKHKRNELKNKSNTQVEQINTLKKHRDILNEIAKGRLENLKKAYRSKLEVLSKEDLSLKHEIELFDRVMELGRRLIAIYVADYLHKEISKTYENLKNISDDLKDLSKEIQELAKESQIQHKKMMSIIQERDIMQKEANIYHLRLMEKYKNINPIGEKIGALKKTIADTREELSLYVGQYKDIQINKKKKMKEEKRNKAKQKLSSNGRLRLDIDELRLLMDSGDISFK